MKTPSRRTWLLMINLLAFQLAWFVCVLGAARGAPVPGIAAVSAAVALQLVLSSARAHDAALIAVALAIGLAWDTVMVRTGTVVYAAPGPLPDWAPGWILALWALFATTLREPLRWLHGRWLLAALIGGGGGALSYAGAVRLGAGHFPDATRAMCVLAAGWAVITPLLIELARWLGERERAVAD
ncbi:MAG TPA: DUF2878 domain-containing protein [Burkholderiaceae bacterium]